MNSSVLVPLSARAPILPGAPSLRLVPAPRRRRVRICYFNVWADGLEDAAAYAARVPSLDLRPLVSDPRDEALLAKARLDCDWYAENARAFAAIEELRRGDGPAKVTIPVTVIAAGEDRLVDNRVLRRVTGRFPRGEYIEIAGAYHEILQETDDLRAVFWREFDALAAVIAP